MKFMGTLWFGLGCFMLGLCFVGGAFAYTAVLALPCFFMAWLVPRFGESRKLSTENPGPMADERRPPDSFQPGRNIEVSIDSLKDRRRQYMRELEENIDKTLLDGLSVLRHALSAHTYAVFVPHRVDGLYLRIWITESESIIPGARLVQGQGLVGRLLKDDVQKVLETDLVTTSQQLHYYSGNEGIKSIAGVPIMINGTRRGAVVADSLSPNAFSTETLEILRSFASITGQFMYAAYTNSESTYQRDQLAALTTYQRKFLENMSEDEIIVYLEDYLTQSIEADRFMLIGREDGSVDTPKGLPAKVLFCKGVDEGYFRGFEFNLTERGLIRVVFEKEQIISKTFNKLEKSPRLSPRERINDGIKCLYAVPVRTDKGVTHVLSMESGRRSHFNEHQKELLLTISRAAGFALSRARLYEEKKEMSRRDGLTGLINHKTFQEQYKTEILRAQRDHYQIMVLMLDIDFFKQVNDRYGHPVGDMVLKDVAEVVSLLIRGGHDTVARYGGEEFVCMLTQTSVTKAKETAERIRQAIQAREYDVGAGQKLNITMSIGAGVYPNDSKYGREVLEKADKALYHAKKTGRNRIVFYSE